VPQDRATSTPRYNPLEKLPILLLSDGSSVYESSYILRYLELKHPQVPLAAARNGWPGSNAKSKAALPKWPNSLPINNG